MYLSWGNDRMYLSLLTLKCLSTEKKDTDCLGWKLKVPQGVVHKLSLKLFSDDT